MTNDKIWSLIEKKINVLGQALNGCTQEDMGASSAENALQPNDMSYDDFIRTILDKVICCFFCSKSDYIFILSEFNTYTLQVDAWEERGHEIKSKRKRAERAKQTVIEELQRGDCDVDEDQDDGTFFLF
jgi:hypothetical protein